MGAQLQNKIIPVKGAMGYSVPCMVSINKTGNDHIIASWFRSSFWDRFGSIGKKVLPIHFGEVSFIKYRCRWVKDDLRTDV